MVRIETYNIDNLTPLSHHCLASNAELLQKCLDIVQDPFKLTRRLLCYNLIQWWVCRSDLVIMKLLMSVLKNILFNQCYEKNVFEFWRMNECSQSLCKTFSFQICKLWLINHVNNTVTLTVFACDFVDIASNNWWHFQTPPEALEYVEKFYWAFHRPRQVYHSGWTQSVARLVLRKWSRTDLLIPSIINDCNHCSLW